MGNYPGGVLVWSSDSDLGSHLPSLPQFLPHCKVGVIIVLIHRFIIMIKSLNV